LAATRLASIGMGKRFATATRTCALVALLLPALVIGACGSSSTSTTTSASPGASATGSPSAAQLQARVNVAKCMRAHGIDVPDPGPNGPSAAEMQRLQRQYSPAQLQGALKSCRSSLTQAFPQLADPAVLAQRRQQALQFAHCMRAHGIDIPDPPSQGPGLGIAKALSSVDQNSPTFKSANAACGGLRPSGRLGG
jgi:hypothetical protein